MNDISRNRIKKELELFSNAPPSGISCAPSNDRLDALSAQIIGPTETPYEGGIFQLEIQIPDRYPFEPPSIRFVTPIYHPNIDTSGRICLDTLKLPPKGAWRPCLNVSTVLMMIRVLMEEPGSEDPLMTDIWQEFRYDYTTYKEKARQWTKQHAMDSHICQDNVSSPKETNTDVELKIVSCNLSPGHSSSKGKIVSDISTAAAVLKQDKRKGLAEGDINVDSKKAKFS